MTSGASAIKLDSQPEVIALIEDCITCGYFLRFCDAEFSAENLRFVIEVQNFQILFESDLDCWKSSTKSFDNRVVAFEDDLSQQRWPSTLVQENVVKKKMDQIIETFLVDAAPYQVCLSAPILARTMERCELLSLFGPTVFNEALQEPMKTLCRDVFPRFQKSQLFVEMQTRIQSLEQVNPDELIVPLPSSSLAKYASVAEINTAELTFQEVVNCQYLFNVFLNYTQNQYCSENLLCYRMILVYEQRFKENLDVGNICWDIYRYFIVSGACFEISINNKARRTIMSNLAKPTSDMFRDAKKSVEGILTSQFMKFQSTEEYSGLKDLLGKEWNDQQRSKKAGHLHISFVNIRNFLSHK